MGKVLEKFLSKRTSGFTFKKGQGTIEALLYFEDFAKMPYQKEITYLFSVQISKKLSTESYEKIFN